MADLDRSRAGALHILLAQDASLSYHASSTPPSTTPLPMVCLHHLYKPPIIPPPPESTQLLHHPKHTNPTGILFLIRLLPNLQLLKPLSSQTFTFLGKEPNHPPGPLHSSKSLKKKCLHLPPTIVVSATTSFPWRRKEKNHAANQGCLIE